MMLVAFSQVIRTADTLAFNFNKDIETRIPGPDLGGGGPWGPRGPRAPGLPPKGGLPPNPSIFISRSL